jgi:hypothetical protein
VTPATVFVAGALCAKGAHMAASISILPILEQDAGMPSHTANRGALPLVDKSADTPFTK